MSSVQNAPVGQAIALMSKIQNQLTWFVRCSEFGVLWMNFGEPHLSVQGPYRSNWQLFVESADWEAVGGPYRASRTSEASERDQALDQLDGQRLLDARFDQQTARWVLTFDLGGILVIGRAKLGAEEVGSEQDENQWTLFFWNAGSATWTLDGRLVFEGQQDRSHTAA